jgi:hypothetical protein
MGSFPRWQWIRGPRPSSDPESCQPRGRFNLTATHDWNATALRADQMKTQSDICSDAANQLRISRRSSKHVDFRAQFPIRVARDVCEGSIRRILDSNGRSSRLKFTHIICIWSSTNSRQHWLNYEGVEKRHMTWDKGLFEAGGWTFCSLSHYLMFPTRFDQTRMQNFDIHPFLPSPLASLFFWPSWALRYCHCSQIQPEGCLVLYIGAWKIHGQPHKGRRACPSVQWIFIEYGEGISLAERAESDLQT